MTEGAFGRVTRSCEEGYARPVSRCLPGLDRCTLGLLNASFQTVKLYPEPLCYNFQTCTFRRCQRPQYPSDLPGGSIRWRVKRDGECACGLNQRSDVFSDTGGSLGRPPKCSHVRSALMKPERVGSESLFQSAAPSWTPRGRRSGFSSCGLAGSRGL